ncbi:MAG: nickel-dependent lactate racemase [Calditrichaeota bacterium]|nr:MAG: nickel-dependent lactate racemase [Calditrichota bacterium]
MLQLTDDQNWQVKTYPMTDAVELEEDELVAAIEDPIGTKKLAELVVDKKKIAIAVDDLSRPTPTEQVLEFLLAELDNAGVPTDAITIIISLGTHTALSNEQLYKKLGKNIVDSIRVINHDCNDNLATTGISVGKTEVLLNKDFLEADFRILIGSVVPHHFAGFSGGAKMVLPGLSNLDSIAWTHKAVMMGLRSKPGTLENNRFRAEFERVARHVGIDFCVNVVVNSKREVAGLFAGELIEAHAKAAEFAKEVYATEAVENLDVAIFNSYPKDTELLQVENAFMYMHTVSENLVRENGTIVVTAACSEGLGKHGLFEPESGVLYRKPMPKRFLKNRNVIFFLPGVSEEEFYQVYWEGYHFANDWKTVVNKINKWHPNGCEIGVFPHASIQIQFQF